MTTARPDRSGHPAMPFSDWPECDRLAWGAVLHRPDFLDDGGRGAAWRPASRRAAQGAYGRLLAWMKAQGIDLAAEAPVERFTRDCLRAYIAFLRAGRSSVTVASYLGILCMMLVAMFPERDWRWLQLGRRRLKRAASPTRRKHERLVPARALSQLGFDLIAQAGEVLDAPFDPVVDRTKRVAVARDYRDGLVIALLASRPLRVKNLPEAKIGTHLRAGSTGFIVQFNASEMKTYRAYHTVLPEALTPIFQKYLAEIRPMLIGAVPRTTSRRPAGALLWVAQGGTPLSEATLYKAMNRHTRQRFGHAVTTHLFRDCVATTVANEDPENARHAAPLLGHATLRTAERNYIASDSSTGLSKYHDLLASIRSRRRSHRGGSIR